MSGSTLTISISRIAGRTSSKPSSITSSIGSSSRRIWLRRRNSALPRLPVSARRQQRGGDGTFFRQQNVIGATRGAGVHRVEHDTSAAECLAQRRRNELHPP